MVDLVASTKTVDVGKWPHVKLNEWLFYFQYKPFLIGKFNLATLKIKMQSKTAKSCIWWGI